MPVAARPAEPPSADSVLARVQHYYSLRLFDNVIFYCQRMNAELPHDVLLGYLGRSYFELGEFERSIQFLQESSTLENRWLRAPRPRGSYTLAQCHFSLRDFEMCETVLLSDSFVDLSSLDASSIYSLIPGGEAGLYLLARCYLQTKRLEKAKVLLRLCLESDPFMWCAYEKLCEMGEEYPIDKLFRNADVSPRDRETPFASRDAPLKRPHDPPPSFLPSSPPSAPRRDPPSYNKPQQPVSLPRELYQRFASLFADLHLGRPQSGLKMYDSLPEAHRSSLRDVRARLFVEDGQLERAHQIEPHGRWLVDRYSSVLWQEGAGDELSVLAQQRVKAAPLSPLTWVVIGNCFSYHKDHLLALKYFHRALFLDPEYAYAHTLLGQEYIYNEDYPKAISHFQSAIALNPRLYHAWFGLGTVYYEQEQSTLSEYHFRKALSLHPSSPLLVGSLCHLYRGRGPAAVSLLDSGLRAHPEHPNLLYQRAELLFELGAAGEAYSTLQRGIDRLQEPYAYILLGRVCAELGHTGEAIRAFTTAIALDPKDSGLARVVPRPDRAQTELLGVVPPAAVRASP